MVKAQQWLKNQEIYNTKKKREEVEKLEIRKNDLEGELNLTEFIKLKNLTLHNNKITKIVLNKCSDLMFLDCIYTNLTELDLSNNSNLRKIEVENNKLSKVDLPTNKENLEVIHIGGNNFSRSLELFGEYTNLISLDISNNLFSGSLKPLQDLNKLNYLNIADTNINSGLEYLPTSIKNFFCHVQEKSKAKVKKLWEELAPFSIIIREARDKQPELIKWKEKNYPKKIRERDLEIERLENELEIEREEFKNFQDKSAEYSLNQVEIIKKQREEIRERDLEIKRLEQQNDLLCQKLADLQQKQEQLQVINPYQK